MEAWKTCYCLHFFHLSDQSRKWGAVSETEPVWSLVDIQEFLTIVGLLTLIFVIKNTTKLYFLCLMELMSGFIHWYLTYSSTRMSFLPVFDGHSESGHVCTCLVIKMVMYIKFTSAEYQDIHFVTHLFMTKLIVSEYNMKAWIQVIFINM